MNIQQCKKTVKIIFKTMTYEEKQNISFDFFYFSDSEPSEFFIFLSPQRVIPAIRKNRRKAK